MHETAVRADLRAKATQQRDAQRQNGTMCDDARFDHEPERLGEAAHAPHIIALVREAEIDDGAKRRRRLCCIRLPFPRGIEFVEFVAFI